MVVDLLETGVGVPHKAIFCSSLKGQSIKPGKGFVDSIRGSLDDATCVLALISEAYYASAFCMCELGGTWLVTKSFLPVLVPPLDYSDLKAVLNGLQVSKLASEEDLDELFGPQRYRLARDSSQIERDVSLGRVGQELFPWLILLAALILGAEHVVANRFYRK